VSDLGVKRWEEPLLVGHPETVVVLDAIFAERLRQDQLFGPRQSYPDGNCLGGDRAAMERAQEKVEKAKVAGTLTWRDLLNEEIAEARAADNPGDLRRELVQAAALIVSQIEDIDRRPKGSP
jgi:hypothetical protein